MQSFIRSVKILIEDYGLKLFFLFIAIILGIYIISVALIPTNSSQQVEAIEASIRSFYPDDQHILPNEDVDLEDVNQLVEDANRLNGAAKEELYPQALLLAEKCAAIDSLEMIYSSSNFSSSSLASLSFLNQVNESLIKSYCQPDNWILEDAGTAIINQFKSHARSDWNLIHTLDEEMHHLNQLSSINRSDINRIIDQLVELTNQSDLVNHHPQTEAIQQKLQIFQEALVAALLTSHEKSPYSEDILMKLFESDSLATLIEDTALDARSRVALTFDDGPNEGYTTQVLEILKEHSIQATFFVVGRSVEMYPEIARQIVDEGHTIANHSYDHPDYSKISDQEVLEQVNQTQEIIQRATGVTPTFYRMPYGSGGERVYRMFPNLTSITWNTDTGDWYLRDAQAIFDNLAYQASDDMLVLLHDTNQDSVDALKKIIPAFIESDYRFVGPTELDYDYRY